MDSATRLLVTLAILGLMFGFILGIPNAGIGIGVEPINQKSSKQVALDVDRHLIFIDWPIEELGLVLDIVIEAPDHSRR